MAVMHNLPDKVSPASRKKESKSVCVREMDRGMQSVVGRIWVTAAKMLFLSEILKWGWSRS